jgi:hypothetical protein
MNKQLESSELSEEDLKALQEEFKEFRWLLWKQIFM